MKKYKIGEFSKYLGVTADFVKYYEQLNVASAEKTTVPKRYAFHNAGRVIECLRLKSCGFHSREIRQIFASVSSDELMTMMQENADQLKKEMMQKQVSYQGHQALAAWAARTKDNPAPYEYLELPAHYFLHHTDYDNFVEDPAVYQALPSWMEWMPAVKSARRLRFAHDPAGPVLHDKQWGFIVEKSFAEQYGLTINEACLLVPAQRVFCYRLYNTPTHPDPALALQDALRAANENNVNITGEVIQDILLRYNDHGVNRCWSNVYFLLSQSILANKGI